MVVRLILKDWYLTRVTLVIVASVGIASVGALYLRDGFTSLLAMFTALIAVIFLGALMPSQTIVNERKRQNLAFVMSLPVSPMQYTAAKVVANVSAFLVLWLPIAVGMVGTVVAARIYGGIVPLMVVAALLPFVGFAVFLAVAIVTESEALSVGTMAASNVSYSLLWLFLSRVPGFWQDLSSPVPVWSPLMISVVTVEVTLIVLAIGLTFYLQSKKTDFI
jgi:hypothetical protein